MIEFKENKPSSISRLSPEQALVEQSLIAEAKRLREEEPKKWLGFLNNFHSYVLPENNGIWRTKREQYKKLEKWDKENRDGVADTTGHSDLWLNQTGKEFFETIDMVISDLDTDGEITKAIARFCTVRNYAERVQAQEEMEEKLIPVFARLFAMGYAAKELRG